MARKLLLIVVALSLLALPALAQDSAETVRPESVAELFYNLYAAYTRFGIQNEADWDALVDWGVKWDEFLSDDLLASLTEQYASDDLMADPVLCAQDIPTHITVEIVNPEQSKSVSVLVRGDFPSDENEYIMYELATVELLPADDGMWQLVRITCAGR
ncbi:MAG: hypothetical protein HZC41_09460 [Chloroflexi bacterium]|nr:hypothetical protein [Chloroflexota bacterium]